MITNEDIFQLRTEYEKETGFKVDYLSDSITTYTNWLEKRIVKLFAIHDVNNQRELLFAYEKSFESENVDDSDLYDEIDKFLSK